MSMHGQDQYCTCSWSEANPCPHKLKVTTTGGASEIYQFSPNNVQHMDQIIPDVEGEYVVAIPRNGCDPLTNEADMDGKYCITYRGACFFQDKVDNCNAGGALGTIIVNTGEEFFTVWITETYNKPAIAIAQSVGDKLIAEEGSGHTLSLGKGIGVDSPDPEYSAHDPLVMINKYTGIRTEDEAPFQTARGWFMNIETDWLYAWGIDGSSTEFKVLDMDQSPPLEKGGFDLGIEGTVRTAYQKDNTIIIIGDHWADSLHLFNIKGGLHNLNPEQLGSIQWEPCSDTDFMGGFEVHPNQNYLYVAPSLHEEEKCQHMTVTIYDISVPSNPQKVGEFDIPEAEHNGSIECMEFGADNIALFCLTSGGLAWYDFTDPLAPTPVAYYDFVHHTETYTYGAYEAQWVSGDLWYVTDRTENWNNFHSFNLVDLSEDCEEYAATKITEYQLNNPCTCGESECNNWSQAAVSRYALDNQCECSDSDCMIYSDSAVSAFQLENPCNCDSDNSSEAPTAVAIIFALLTICACI
eukprot:UN29084